MAFGLVLFGAIVCVGAAPSAGAASRDLLVSSSVTGSVLRYDGVTGAFVGSFVPAGPFGARQPRAMAFGPDGNLYVGVGLPGVPGIANPSIMRFDGASGAFIDTFYSPPFGNFNDITFGPDGNFYGSLDQPAPQTAVVVRVDPETGALLGSIGGGILQSASGLAFGPDGSLYVGSYSTGHVRRFDPATGALLGEFMTRPIACNGCPVDISIGPDGILYVEIHYSATIPTEIWRFDPDTGDDLGRFIPVGQTRPFIPGILAFGPDGNVYVPSGNTDQVLRYDGTTGDFIDVFAQGGGLDFPWAAVFTSPACSDRLDNDGDGVRDFGADLGCESEEDSDERGASAGGWALVCDNGVDEDGDGLFDHPDDPGCFSAAGYTESPRCDDGADNDGDGAIDHPADPECKTSWDTSELHAGSQCGIGFELAFVLPPLMWLYRRRRA